MRPSRRPLGPAGADHKIAAVPTAIGIALWAVTSGVQRFVARERVGPDRERLDSPTS